MNERMGEYPVNGRGVCMRHERHEVWFCAAVPAIPEAPFRRAFGIRFRYPHQSIGRV
uniref:hypothetical protein n=1 Tax=Methanogenium sp. MK-MG TaxID=2599926 RepID=UPI0013EC6151|nr:hypothetical protein [Methanogenium sp. MK-MG]